MISRLKKSTLSKDYPTQHSEKTCRFYGKSFTNKENANYKKIKSLIDELRNKKKFSAISRRRFLADSLTNLSFAFFLLSPKSTRTAAALKMENKVSFFLMSLRTTVFSIVPSAAFFVSAAKSIAIAI